MSVKTNNIYGKILISDKTIEKFVSHVAMDCYGIVEFASKGTIDSVVRFLKIGSKMKGVKVHSSGDRIFIDMSVIVKYGVSIKAVVEALKESIKYKVERFTGMIVDTINVRVMGVKA
jgi:uncharacterized alkaline shock family protein YloU